MSTCHLILFMVLFSKMVDTNIFPYKQLKFTDDFRIVVDVTSLTTRTDTLLYRM